jgi:hypothetical protein
MSKNGKGFEKFLREARGVTRNVTQQIADNRYGGQTQTFRAEKSPEEEDAYQKAKQAFELQMARQEATTNLIDVELKDKYGNPVLDSKGNQKYKKVRVPAKEEGLTPEEEEKFGVAGFIPSAGQVEQAFERSREASAKIDETERQNKKISPAYWVTQADFQQAFNRPYNAMSKEDQRDFFQLVQNAPGATRRTDVGGADVGAVIPSTVRPKSLPKFQDVGGIKVPQLGDSRKSMTDDEIQRKADQIAGEWWEKETDAARESGEPYVTGEPRITEPAPAPESSYGVEGPGYDKNKPLETSANFPERPADDWWKQSATARPPGFTDQQLQPEKPWTPFWRASDQGLYDLMKDAAEAPEPKPSSADVEIGSDEFGPGRRQPSGLEQATRFIQGAGEFGRNLDQAAGRKVREVGQNVLDIADRMRQRKRAPEGTEILDTEKTQQISGLFPSVPEFKGYVTPESEEWNKLSDSEKRIMAAQALVRGETQKFFGGRQKEEGGFLGIGAKKLNRFSEDQRGQTPSETAYLNRVAKMLNKMLDDEETTVRGERAALRGEIEAEAARRAKEIGGDIVNKTFLRQFQKTSSPKPQPSINAAPTVNIQSQIPSEVKASIDRLALKQPRAETAMDFSTTGEKTIQTPSEAINPESTRMTNLEFEKIFGTENRNLPLEVKQKLLNQYKMQLLLGVKPTKSTRPQAKPGPEKRPQREGMRRVR